MVEGEWGEARSRLARLGGALEIRERPDSSDVDSVSARQLTRLLEISRAIHRIHNRDELLAYVNDRLRELFDAQNGFVVLFGEDRVPIIQSSSLEAHGLGALPVSETLLDRVRVSREPVIVDDATRDHGLKNQQSIELLRIASALCAPLIVEDEVIGVLQFDQRGEPHPFSRSDLRLLALFADQVASALYDLRLIERLNGALEQTKAAQEQLVRAERLSALGEMAAGIAHNFNNALLIALGLCDLLLAKDDLDEDTRTTVTRISTCALDAAETVRRLQVFTRTAEKETTTVVPSEILDFVRELTRRKWSDEALLRGVAISVEVDVGSTPPVRARAAELREVLVNLIFNAVDAMVASGTIRLSSGTVQGEVFLAVRDAGSGMTEAQQKQLFDPFYTTKGPRGGGLGLSTSWSIVHRLGGRIEVESALGIGSTFTVWLPAAKDVDVTPESAGETVGRRARILVVDDDPDVLDTVLQLLETLGHDVTGFTAAAPALELFTTCSFDLVISDMGMPGLTGNDVAREAHRQRPDVPVILLTGWGNHLEAVEDVESSVAEVLAKPVTMVGLEAAVQRCLA